MGAWGCGPFENDAALDWVWTLDDGAVDAIDHAISADLGDADSDDAAAAVAAAAIVAVATDGSLDGLPEGAAKALADHRAEIADRRQAARAALASVRDVGELRDLWAESDELDAWLGTLAAIDRRLQDAATSSRSG